MPSACRSHKRRICGREAVRGVLPSAKDRQRASRRERVRGRDARLCDRDLDILLALAKMRLLRTSDLTRLFFSAKGTCQKRLRKLYDAGLVRAVVTDLASENRYAATRLGYDLLQEALEGTALPPFRPAPRVDGRNVTHLDLLNGYRIALALGAGERGVELRTFVPEWELRAKDHLATLVPDAIFSIASPGSDVLHSALEVDTGTEASNVVLRKLSKYRERHALRQPIFGFTVEALVLLAKTERRARALAKQVIQSGGTASGPILLLGTEGTVMTCGGLDSGLTMARDLEAAKGGSGAFTLGLARALASTE